MFVFSPSLLLIGEVHEIALNIGTAVIGVYLISVATIGYFTRPLGLAWRSALIVAGGAALLPAELTPEGALIEILGAALGILMLAYEWWATRRARTVGFSAE